MKIKSILKVLEADGCVLPRDMAEDCPLGKHYSVNQDKWLDIRELDIFHVIRILKKKETTMKKQNENTGLDSQHINDQLSFINLNAKLDLIIQTLEALESSVDDTRYEAENCVAEMSECSNEISSVSYQVADVENQLVTLETSVSNIITNRVADVEAQLATLETSVSEILQTVSSAS